MRRVLRTTRINHAWRPAMKTLKSLVRQLLASAALALPLVSTPALADPVSYFVPFQGQGNVAVFDSTAGTGGWVGSIDQVQPPVVASPLSLVSVVLFTVDAATQTFSGSFQFTTTDLMSTLFGDISGTVSAADILDNGGQFAIDYLIQGGTGLFSAASGFGLAFLDFNPLAVGDNNYLESGLLNFSVPEPATLGLVGLALMAALSLSGTPRRARR
jgi:PEP-CTERM motif